MLEKVQIIKLQLKKTSFISICRPSEIVHIGSPDPNLPTEIMALLLWEIATKRHNYCPYLYKMFYSEYIEGLNQEQQEH